jgi:hypothetical protein
MTARPVFLTDSTIITAILGLEWHSFGLKAEVLRKRANAESK